MKFFFSSYFNPDFESFSEYIEAALKKLGHEVLIFDWYKFFFPGRARQKLPFLQSLEIKRINNALLKKVKKFRPDIVLIAGGFTINSDTINAIKQLENITTINWSADYPRNFEYHIETGPYFDYLFTSAADGLKNYRKRGHKNGHWLPFACDADIHKPIDVSEKEREKYSCDVCFVGSNYPERVAILEKLSGFNLGIWGIGWDKLPSNSPLKQHIRGGVSRPEEWTKIYSCSKIVLNILSLKLDGAIDLVDPEYGHIANTRVFEALGCGAFQLVELKSDVIKLFKTGDHLVCYEDSNQLIKLIKYYLNNPEDRKRIANNGRRIAIEKHTYQHRINEILSTISNNQIH
jgi:spore maturation protein CgeB